MHSSFGFKSRLSYKENWLPVPSPMEGQAIDICRKAYEMMSLPAIIGISLGVAGVVAFGRKTQPQSTLKKIGVFILATVGMLAIILAVNFAMFYANHR